MIEVVILGSGNVATHLYKAFEVATHVKVVQVYCRTESEFFPKAIQIHQFSEIINADVYIISVTDDAIAEVANQLQFKDRIVVHTSGSTDLYEINDKNKRGVFYPLQTFSKNKIIDFKNIPICIEAEDEFDYILLEKLASSISNSVYPINGEQRKALHIAAVFVCNFVNHLYTIGQNICEENQIPFEILIPLITETSEKIKILSPKEAQTGPAKRNDLKTIAHHLQFLKNEKQIEIYKILTQSIQNEQKL